VYDSTMLGYFGVIECIRRIYSQGTMGKVREFVLVKVLGKNIVSSKELVSY
jgi:hypothetical protein